MIIENDKERQMIAEAVDTLLRAHGANALANASYLAVQIQNYDKEKDTKDLTPKEKKNG